MQRIILDLDVGTDDALALLVLIRAEKYGLVKIEAICCTSGNTCVENVCKHVIRILELMGRTDIPVYRGSEEQIVHYRNEPGNFHGKDGFGDLEYEADPDLTVIKTDPSAIGMNNIVTKYPGEIVLVCLGPLTNVALAMKLYRNFASNLKEIYLMGGNYKAVGNATKTAEFNFYVDPESAHIVLNRSKCPISIVTWEACMLRNMTIEWRFNDFGAVNDTVIQLLNKAERSIYKHRTLHDFWYPCDAFLAIVLVYPESVAKESEFHATVELHGHETRGQIVLDHSKKQDVNVRIIKKMNEGFVKNILFETSRFTFSK